MSDSLDRRTTIAQLLAAAAALGGAAGSLASRSAVPATPADAQGVVLLQGEGIDRTGLLDSRSAVQAVLDAAPPGSTVVVPSGAVLRLDGGITVRQPHTLLTGSGELRFRGGGTYSVDADRQNGFIDVRADHCSLVGLHATNPDGVRNRGVTFLANHGRAADNTLIGFGSGIHVSPAGEFHDFTISGNHVLDVLGKGGGPDDTTTSGEDYGDGIMCWGAAVTVTGNVVTCKEGSDARIGIHVEALGDQAPRRWVHGDSMATITGNVVHGPFRRGIVSEGVDHTVVTGNVIADATWWSIALITADHCVVSGNTVIYSRTAKDTQGSAWGPSRSAIMLFRVDEGTVRDCVVVNNVIHVPEGAEAEAGIRITGNPVGPAAIEGGQIAGNRITADGRLQFGVLADRPLVDTQLDDNRLEGWRDAGIAITTHDRASIRGNTIHGPSGTDGSTGIRVEGGSGLMCTGNRVGRTSTGIVANSQSGWSVIDGNAVQDSTVGLDLRGTSGQVSRSGNVFSAVRTAVVGSLGSVAGG